MRVLALTVISFETRVIYPSNRRIYIMNETDMLPASYIRNILNVVHGFDLLLSHFWKD